MRSNVEDETIVWYIAECGQRHHSLLHPVHWASNSRQVLASIPSSERAPTMVNLDFDSLPNSVALGVGWNVETDAFQFRIWGIQIQMHFNSVTFLQ